jgi:hypothetical protein
MNNLFRGLIAGYGAKKLGGGCFGTILVFILIWVALGQCSAGLREIPEDKKQRKSYLPVVSYAFETTAVKKPE